MATMPPALLPRALLPPNATPLEQALAQTMAAQIGAIAAPLRDLYNPATCPVALLPWLAAMLGVEGWDSTWPETIKRARIASAIAIHRQKGTIAAVQAVIAAYGGIAQLTLSDPYAFHLVISLAAQGGTAPSADLITGLIDDITRAKSARDTFTFTIANNAVGSISIVGGALGATYARIEATCANA